MKSIPTGLIFAITLMLGCASSKVAPGSFEADLKTVAQTCHDSHLNVSPNRKDISLNYSLNPSAASNWAVLSNELIAAEIPEKRHSMVLNTESKRPRHCVALSGGGQRSAAYAIGVLGAMQTHPGLRLEDTAYMSGVSGGGYALGWLVSRKNIGERKNLFGLDSKDQIHLSKTSGEGASSIGNIATSVAAFGGLRVEIQHENINGTILSSPGRAHIDYGHALKRQFLDQGNPFADIWRSPPKLSAIHARYMTSDFPYPIWNAVALELTKKTITDIDGHTLAVDLPKNPSGLCPAVREGVFEMSLDKIGNSAIGYLDTKFKKAFSSDALNLLHAMTTSGAAFESPHKNERSLGLKLTSFKDNPTLKLSKLQATSELKDPVPSFWLTDGGRIENLGVLPLLLRGCEHITIVDAEHDPTLVFNAYQNLKQNLEEAFALHLEVKGVDEQLKVHQNAEQECKAAVSSFRESRWAWFSSQSELRQNCFQADRIEANFPLYLGRISQKLSDGVPKKVADISYVKLSLNKASLAGAKSIVATNRDLSQILRAFEGDRLDTSSFSISQLACVGKGLAQRCLFPQQSTMNQALSETEWSAYVSLGRWNYENGKRSPNGSH